MTCELHNVETIDCYEESTYDVAKLYGFGALGVAFIGRILSSAGISTGLKIAGVVLSIFGTFAYFGTVLCGVMNIGKPSEFREEIPKYLTVMSGLAILRFIGNW